MGAKSYQLAGEKRYTSELVIFDNFSWLPHFSAPIIKVPQIVAPLFATVPTYVLAAFMGSLLACFKVTNTLAKARTLDSLSSAAAAAPKTFSFLFYVLCFMTLFC